MANLNPLTNGSYWGPVEPPEVISLEKIFFATGFVGSSITSVYLPSLLYLLSLTKLLYSCSIRLLSHMHEDSIEGSPIRSSQVLPHGLQHSPLQHEHDYMDHFEPGQHARLD